LPVPIARELQINTLFSSAFLSELAEEELVRISKIKVGGSPLYFLPKHETMLENFTKFLPPKEKEAFSMLKEKTVLKDLGLDPALRVALRNIKDFSYPVLIELNNEKTLFWRYFTIKEAEAIEKIKELMKGHTPIQQAPKQLPEPPIEKPVVTETIKESQTNIQQPKTLAPILKQEEKVEKPIIKNGKEKKESEFSSKILKMLGNESLEITERLEGKKNEFYAKVLVNSQIGKTPYLCIAKEKKKLNENDFALAVQKAQNMKLPVLFVSAGTPSVKAKNYLENWQGLLKFKQLSN
jgi:hypothetical protein